jgi:hypothetical protein
MIIFNAANQFLIGGWMHSFALRLSLTQLEFFKFKHVLELIIDFNIEDLVPANQKF